MHVVKKRSLVERMQGAAMLKVDVYEEVEHDADATGQAALVVGIVAVCAAIGGVGTGGPIGGLISAFLGWLVWAGVTYVIGDKLLGGTATWGELLRTLGFAQAPGILYILGIIPFLGWIPVFVVGIWLLVTGFIAIRQALDFGNAKAFLTAVLGFLAYGILAAVVAALL